MNFVLLDRRWPNYVDPQLSL